MLKLSVTGSPGEGKTTLLALVAKFLQESGIKTGYDGPNAREQTKELENLVNNMTSHDFDVSKFIVVLEEVQLPRGEPLLSHDLEARRQKFLKLLNEGWFPMSTAPRDGSFFLAVSTSGRVEPVQFLEDPLKSDKPFGRGNMRLKCVCWQPMPSSGLEEVI